MLLAGSSAGLEQGVKQWEAAQSQARPAVHTVLLQPQSVLATTTWLDLLELLELLGQADTHLLGRVRQDSPTGHLRPSQSQPSGGVTVPLVQDRPSTQCTVV